ncbi:MAG: hypothetical protein HPY67_04080 [Syntrophaceae bacterium]|nr:hypothetical protein [Syntrophaceae bacterium]
MGPLHQGRLKKLPQTRIVFDLFHVVAAFNRVIDRCATASIARPKTSTRRSTRAPSFCS